MRRLICLVYGSNVLKDRCRLNGFALVELMMVVVISAVLATPSSGMAL